MFHHEILAACGIGVDEIKGGTLPVTTPIDGSQIAVLKEALSGIFISLTFHPSALDLTRPTRDYCTCDARGHWSLRPICFTGPFVQKKYEMERSDSGTIPGQIVPKRSFFAILFPV
ncbi:MAG: hypothetical protein K8F90_09575 [Hyphomicrobiales bacterium]|nr:hypothetical protein [Hyphomicrobiales bacterium]